MIPLIKISQILIDKLTRISEPSFAKLYGVFFENTAILLAIQVESKNENELQYSLPTEVDLCGVVSIGQENSNQTEVIKKLKDQIDVTDNPIYLSCNGKSNELSLYVLVHEQLNNRPFTVISEQEIYEHLVYVRLSGCFPITCSADRFSYDGAILNLRNLATTGKLGFNFSKTPIYLLGTENEIESSLIGTSGEPIVGDICKHSTDEDNFGRKRKMDFTYQSLRILDIDIFRKVTTESIGSNENEHAPICIVTKKQKDTAYIPVKIDVLSLISKQTNLNRLYSILVESIVKCLKAYHLTILKNLVENAPILPEVYHFYPNDCGHFVSIWMPKNADQNTLESSRRALHEQFLLPTNRPLFKRENRYIFKGSTLEGEPLINPHENLKNTNNGGTIALVKGKYSYYHYNQNRMNDSGWGCAYRSLQTLASWFKLQGYTDKEVPTFEEIQKCLVDIGDKPSSFIGSTQWIGSMEVNFVLDTLLGVTCRIVNVTNGLEMAYEGPELVRHFEEYGSPIMIGGGNLAHTIIGVDYNESTGNIKFLILDPHYTGSEDLQIIQNKGWCGWKGVEFWNKTSYYNMCLPLVPSGV